LQRTIALSLQGERSSNIGAMIVNAGYFRTGSSAN
jgi:hypothetical protein